MAAPVTQQVSGGGARSLSPALTGPESGQPLAPSVAELPVLDASGRRLPFGALFRERRAVVVFVRHFLCYICKEYVEDLAKIPRSFLQVSFPRAGGSALLPTACEWRLSLTIAVGCGVQSAGPAARAPPMPNRHSFEGAKESEMFCPNSFVAIPL
ncbi:Thioredoxin-like protein AAED1 [Sciurus carolinensis]|uniref:Thioredoxin-like protein AAED1 n=1 Tax=Sciurus carolinensis TaxID=30640 RepID=A0AA41MM72_SCICA|nr:Thioredoxin-like protein AAED1 [Sciurus carolinensis]